LASTIPTRVCTRIATSSESAGNLGTCGSPRLVATFLQSEIAYPLTQTPQIFRPIVFRDNAAAGADDRGEPYDAVAATSAYNLL